MNQEFQNLLSINLWYIGELDGCYHFEKFKYRQVASVGVVCSRNEP